MSKTVFVVLCAVALLVGCSSDNAAIKALPKGSTLAMPDPPKPVVVEYALAPADVIQVEVFNVPTLNQTVQLDGLGAIDLMLIGKVQAGGKTATQLGAKLQELYGEKYLQNPQVSVFLKQAHVETVTVDGSVTTPGVYPISAQTSLIKALALAHGLDQLANPKQVVVFRNVNNQRVAGVFDLTEIRTGKAADPPIYPNDTIVVASSGTRRTLRDIVGVTPLMALLPLIP
jgi:polysaccharide export outer membrane protein